MSRPEAAAGTAVRVVVTGGGGFIGRRVVARLAESGRSVVAVDPTLSTGDLPYGVEGRRMALGREWLSMPEAFVLVHLAWGMERSDSAAQTESAAVFRAQLSHPNLTGVVGMGSAEEYGERGGCLSEDLAPGDELSVYGRAKNEACGALEAWTRETGRPAVWLRPFVVYGPGQGGGMVLPYALRCARERRLAEFTDGRQRRDFIHVDDVAEGIAQAVRRLPGMEFSWTVCNLGRGEPVAVRDVLERMADRMGARELFRFGVRPRRLHEPAEQYADLTAAAVRLGWRARTPWTEGIDGLCAEGK